MTYHDHGGCHGRLVRPCDAFTGGQAARGNRRPLVDFLSPTALFLLLGLSLWPETPMSSPIGVRAALAGMFALLVLGLTVSESRSQQVPGPPNIPGIPQPPAFTPPTMPVPRRDSPRPGCPEQHLASPRPGCPEQLLASTHPGCPEHRTSFMSIRARGANGNSAAARKPNLTSCPYCGVRFINGGTGAGWVRLLDHPLHTARESAHDPAHGNATRQPLCRTTLTSFPAVVPRPPPSWVRAPKPHPRLRRQSPGEETLPAPPPASEDTTTESSSGSGRVILKIMIVVFGVLFLLMIVGGIIILAAANRTGKSQKRQRSRYRDDDNDND
jgi:hypothetical protein